MDPSNECMALAGQKRQVDPRESPKPNGSDCRLGGRCPFWRRRCRYEPEKEAGEGFKPQTPRPWRLIDCEVLPVGNTLDLGIKAFSEEMGGARNF